MIRLSEALARLHLDHVVQPRYVEEAYRLLKKSVIHVQTEEVTLEGGEDEEEEEGEEEVEGPEGVAGGEEEGRVRGKKKRGRTNPEGIEEEEEEEVATAAAAVVASEAAPAATAAAAKKKEKKKKKEKRKVQITVEEYRLMTLALATYVRQQENREGGVTWEEVMEWYIQQQQQEGRDDGGEDGLREKVTMVIARMLDVDTTLVPGGEREGGREGGEEDGAAMEEGGEDAPVKEGEEEGGKKREEKEKKKRKDKRERTQLLLRVHPNHPL